MGINLGGNGIAEGVGRKITETASGPVNILKDAFAVFLRRYAEVFSVFSAQISGSFSISAFSSKIIFSTS